MLRRKIDPGRICYVLSVQSRKEFISESVRSFKVESNRPIRSPIGSTKHLRVASVHVVGWGLEVSQVGQAPQEVEEEILEEGRPEEV